MEKTEEQDQEQEQGQDYNPEEEVAEGDWKLVDLPDKEIKSGEEETDELLNVRAKLYRWRDGQWKERGIGQAKLLKHKLTGKASFILRQDATMKLMAFFYVTGKGLCKLQKLQTAEKSLFWSCVDASEGKPVLEKFCIRLKTNEEFENFQTKFEKAYADNENINWCDKTTKVSEVNKETECKEKAQENQQEKKVENCEPETKSD